MADQLVIVESPAKAKTISRFLGKNFVVRASMGHVRDLPKSQIGIDVKHDFEPTYMVPVEKKKVIGELKTLIKKDTKLYIATDEDREGEAIGWHLLEALNVDPKKRDVKRIVFHEITEGAIKGALEHPRDLDMDLVNAQQARRVLDRLVGYELSPLLWKKIRYGLSAGRVQSVAVRLIVEREREIRAFKPDEYWSVVGEFLKGMEMFEAHLTKISGKEIKLENEKDTNKVLKDLEGASYEVTSVEEKEVKRKPAPPFITSTLQQEASRKLGFSVKRTMMIAQQLYEGVELGEGSVGLITYMRTDSVNLSETALKQAREVISNSFGKEYALDAPRYYKGRKGAQEAHEAIRPVDLSIKPDDVKTYLDKDQYRLYELVWKRMLACQMAEARLKAVGVDITPAKDGKSLDYTFRATGQTIEFPGFIRVYVEDYDHPEESENDKEKLLPKLEEGDSLKLNKDLTPNQHFTKPPPRYTEASLVKKLESEGIGRPSTYAPTISTIMTRGYVERENKQLKPTDLAEVVTDMLVEHFPHIVDYKFTAEMEEKLDLIAEGKKEWVPVINEFYTPFHKTVAEKTNSLKKEDIVNLEKTDEKCEKCGSPMIVKLGRFGKFLSCSNYPECKIAKPLPGHGQPVPEKTEADKELERKLAGKKCDKCGEPMEVKTGRYGQFLGCSGYPKCKNIQAIVKLIGVKCPECKEGQLVERRTRKGGRLFYGCNRFPKCKYATWEKPKDATGITSELAPSTGARSEKKVDTTEKKPVDAGKKAKKSAKTVRSSKKAKK
ncbi:MAG TPA: type I DNA topoisomerase [Candidatus Gracilibacteria bacterium]|nr:type I DNA topoisomerase [Candidatus Gracilibacteria bacterium]